MNHKKYRDIVSKCILDGLKQKQSGKEVADIIKIYRAEAVASGIREKECKRIEVNALVDAQLSFEYANHEKAKKE